MQPGCKSVCCKHVHSVLMVAGCRDKLLAAFIYLYLKLSFQVF